MSTSQMCAPPQAILVGPLNKTPPRSSTTTVARPSGLIATILLAKTKVTQRFPSTSNAQPSANPLRWGRPLCAAATREREPPARLPSTHQLHELTHPRWFYRIGFTTDRSAMKARGSWTHKASFLSEFLVGQNATVVQYGEGEFA